MRVLIVHNQLWAHYKSRLFSDIFEVFKKEYPGAELLVAQIALYEASRSVMQDQHAVSYDYPYQVLFERSLDSTTASERRKALFKVFDEFKPDVLNITGWGDPAQLQLMFYAKIKRVKIVISSESSSADHARSGWKETLKSFIIRQGNAFFCFGKTSADYLMQLGIPAAKIPVRHAAVVDDAVIRDAFNNALQTSKAGTRRRFVYVGRLAPEKNLSLLLHAFAGIADPENNWELLFVGDGPEKQSLQNLASELQLEEKVTFAGGHPWYKVPEYLAKCDVLILPSKSEPWGLVVNEAMVCGMPVIVSKTCGCAPDLVENGVNGFTFEPDSQSELEAAMQYFVHNPDQIAVAGKHSLQKIAPFSSEKAAAEMAKTYHNLSKR